MKILCVVVVLMFQFPVRSHCQQTILSPDLRFDNYNSQSTFVSNCIYKLIRSKKGYIWAAGNGVYQFDGKQYTQFSKLKNAHGLRGNYTPWFQEDSNGRIWVGGGLGICYYDDHKNEFTYVDIDDKRKIKYSAALCRVGTDIWFMSNYGLCKVNTTSLKITTTSVKPFECIAMYAINENTLWLSSKVGEYYVYHIRQDKYEKKRLAEYWIGTWGITKHNEQTWFATSDGIWMSPNDTALPQRVPGTEGIHAGAVRFIPFLTGDHMLWIGTSGRGLLLFNIRTHKIEYSFTPDPNNPYSISGLEVYEIFPDQQNIVWLATENGISAINYNNQYFKSYILPENLVSRTAQDSSDKNILWLAGLEHGLFKINWKNKKILHNYFHFKSCWGAPVDGSEIMNMYQVNSDTWLLSSYNVVFTWNSKTGKEKIVSTIPARYFINYKRDSFYIVSSDSIYLCELPSCKIIPRNAANGLNDGEYDGKKYLWLPTGNGLLRYNTIDNSKKIFCVEPSIDNGGGNRMTKAVIDKRGRIICGSTSGVAIFDTITGRFQFYESFGDIRHPVCYDIKLVDSIAFVTTNGGLISMNLNTGSSFIIALRDKDKFSDRPIGTVDDELVLGMMYEFAYFKPSRVLDLPTPSAPLIEKIKVHDQFYYYPANEQQLSLKYNENNIAFYFTAFEFKDPERIAFRYKVEGLDTGWNYSSDSRKVEYMRVQPGKYTFIVQAGNQKGIWNTATAKLYFTIVPPFWQTWWFRALTLLFFIGIVVGISTRRIRNIKKREEEKSAASIAIAEMELKALRSQMNPHFIFNSLNSIQKFIWDNKQEDAAEYLTKFSRLIRMILDNSMHKWITLEQEINTLSLYLELEHRRCNNKFDYFINVDSDVDLSAILFPSLILQPYVENAIWHGLLNKEERGELKITIAKETDDIIQCIIEDNGIGRAAAERIKAKNESKTVSYGTEITSQRLNRLSENGRKGTAVIEDLYEANDSAAGTRIVISIPISAFVKI